MNQRTLPSPHIAPLHPEHTPALKDAFDFFVKTLGFVPNSLLIMQRRPKLVQAFAQLGAAVWDPESTVDRGLKRLIGHMASRAAGCRYCMAHTAGGALRLGIEDAKVEAIWEYQTNPLFSEAERAALDVALAAGSVPNGVTDEMMSRLRQHWDDGQIVEIVGVIAMFGFMNRWNDTMATPLEEEAIEIGHRHLARSGWDIGKHAR
jgi:uncharacterized peroxidase-related enzyme